MAEYLVGESETSFVDQPVGAIDGQIDVANWTRASKTQVLEGEKRKRKGK